MGTTNSTSNNEIDNMVKEVTDVLRNHLINMVKNNQDTSETLDILNKLPIVKNLQSENLNLKKTIIELQSEIAIYECDLHALQLNNPIKAHLQLEVSEIENSNSIKQITINKNPFIVGSVKSEEDCENTLQSSGKQHLGIEQICDGNEYSSDEPKVLLYVPHIVVKKKETKSTEATFEHGGENTLASGEDDDDDDDEEGSGVKCVEEVVKEVVKKEEVEEVV